MTRSTETAARSLVSRLALSGLLLAVLMPAVPAHAGTAEVDISLPVRARIDLGDRNSVAVAPFQVVSREGADTELRGNVDVEKEFERYLLRLLKRETQLHVTETGPVQYPTYDMQLLARQTDFWRALGERTHADLLLTGSLDFDVQDRSGYRREEYISPYDGRTYYRQVLVEQTGFDYDIVMQVYDGKTGKLLYSDNFKDFKQFEGDRADPLKGMFENLYALQDRIAGIFTQKRVQTTRTLFTD
jgi:hypothetical protein